MTVGTAAVHETRKGGRTTALILATAGFAVNFWAWALLSPLSSTYEEMLRLTPFEASVLVAIPVIVGSLGRIVLGALTDRYGGRLMFAVASMLGVVPVVFLAFAGSYPALLAGGFVLGLIYQATGSYAIGLMLLAAVAAAAFVYCWFVLRSPRIARLTQEEGI